MAFTTRSAGPMADINVTPLIDVMLCLLIIFILNAPLPAHQVKVDLPQKSTITPPIDPPPPIELRILASGELIWNDQPLIEAALDPQLRLEAAKNPQPELQIDIENTTHFEAVADVLATAKNAGMTKIGFKNMPGT
jgi:biopolymer transport protein ExbD